MIEHLTTDDLMLLVSELGLGPLRDAGLLDSAAHRPAAVLYGQELYMSIHEKAAVLLEAISRNHALLDGNKRLAWTATIVFYGMNGTRLVAPLDDAYDLVIGVCTGRIPYEHSAMILGEWSTPSSS